MIDLKHLQLIQAINEQGSMTKAAQQLHLTQPALSHQLKELENKLEVNVFERKGRQLELTPVGTRLLQTAGRVLDEMDRTAKDVEKLASGKTGVTSSYHGMLFLLLLDAGGAGKIPGSFSRCGSANSRRSCSKSQIVFGKRQN